MSARVSVVLLNYNSWSDTTSCLESLLRSSARTARIIVVDNNSADDSVEKLQRWAAGTQEAVSSSDGPAHQRGAAPVEKRLACELHNCREGVAGWQFERAPAATLASPPVDGLAIHSPLVILRTQRNGGFAYGCNAGLAYLLAHSQASEWVLLLNNDTVVEPDFLDRMLEEADQDAGIGMATGLIRRFHDPASVWYAGGRLDSARGVVYHYEDAARPCGPVSFASGCFMLIREQVIREVGLLDARYFLGVEDWDYCYRMAEGGWKILYVPKAVIYHKVGASSGGEQSPLSAFHATLGRKRFICERLPLSGRPLALAYFFLTRAIRAGQHWMRGERQLAVALLRGVFVRLGARVGPTY